MPAPEGGKLQCFCFLTVKPLKGQMVQQRAQAPAQRIGHIDGLNGACVGGIGEDPGQAEGNGADDRDIQRCFASKASLEARNQEPRRIRHERGL